MLILLFCQFIRWRIRSSGLRIFSEDVRGKNIRNVIMRKCLIC